MSDPTTRTLSLRVAEHVMGWRRDSRAPTYWISPDGDGLYHDDDVPGYESPGGVWLIMDRLAELGWRTTIIRDLVPAGNSVTLTRLPHCHTTTGPDIPRCLCVAALKAVGAPEEAT